MYSATPHRPNCSCLPALAHPGLIHADRCRSCNLHDSPASATLEPCPGNDYTPAHQDDQGSWGGPSVRRVTACCVLRVRCHLNDLVAAGARKIWTTRARSRCEYTWARGRDVHSCDHQHVRPAGASWLIAVQYGFRGNLCGTGPREAGLSWSLARAFVILIA